MLKISIQRVLLTGVLLTALLFSLAPLPAYSGQETEINSRGNVPSEVFDGSDVLEFGVVKDISTVEFVGTSLMHHFQGISHDVQGFMRLSFAVPQRASAEITVPVDSINGFALGSEKGDLTKNIHMNLESAEFPEMNLKIIQVLPEQSGTAHGRRSYLVKGDLTIHGVTKPMIFNADMDVKDGYLHITGEYDSLNVKDFGVEPKPLMAVINVNDLVDLKFDIYEELKGAETATSQ